MLRKIVLAAAAACGLAAVGQTPVIDLGNKPFTTNDPVKLDNNNRVLTKAAIELINYPDIAGIRVPQFRTDTLYLTLKPEALKRLDADKEKYYEPLDKPKDASKKDSKKSK